MYFDAHAHFDDEQFDTDRELLIPQMHSFGVDYIINAGSDYETSIKSIALSEKYPFIYAAVGVHPENADRYDISALTELTKNKRVVAVGEIGLDYHYDNNPSQNIQMICFRDQLELAKAVDLPVVVHSRDAASDTFEAIKASGLKRGQIHAFSGSLEMALAYIKLGFYISVGGVVTFKNAKKLVSVVENIPIERLLIETDSPYLSPEPNRGKRNDSRNLKFITEKIAQIKNIPPHVVAETTQCNAKTLFNIK